MDLGIVQHLKMSSSINKLWILNKNKQELSATSNFEETLQGAKNFKNVV